LQRERPAARDIEQPELRCAAATLQDCAIAYDGDWCSDRRQRDAVLRAEERVGTVHRQTNGVERCAVSVRHVDGADQHGCGGSGGGADDRRGGRGGWARGERRREA